jgi:hypothetical protein
VKLDQHGCGCTHDNQSRGHVYPCPKAPVERNDFPNIKALGLEVRNYALYGTTVDFVDAQNLEALLAKGVRVYGKTGAGANSHRDKWYWCKSPINEDTHTALLIGITPIVRDTCESLLKELLDCVSCSDRVRDIQERAKKLCT